MGEGKAACPSRAVEDQLLHGGIAGNEEAELGDRFVQNTTAATAAIDRAAIPAEALTPLAAMPRPGLCRRHGAGFRFTMLNAKH